MGGGASTLSDSLLDLRVSKSDIGDSDIEKFVNFDRICDPKDSKVSVRTLVNALTEKNNHLLQRLSALDPSKKPNQSLIASSASAPSLTTAVSNNSKDDAARLQLERWLIDEVSILASVAERYALILIDQKIGTVDRLSKRLSKSNGNLLLDLGFDEDDAEDIVKKLGLPHSTKNLSDTATTTTTATTAATAATAPITKVAEIPITSLKGECLSTLEGHTEIFAIVELCGENKLVSGGDDKKLRVWNLDTLQCEVTVSCCDVVVSLYYFGDSKVAVGLGNDTGKIEIWDLKLQQCTGVLEGHTQGVFSVFSWAADHNYLFSCSSDGTIKVWDISTKLCVFTLDEDNAHGGAAVYSMIQMKTREIITAADDCVIKVWTVTKTGSHWLWHCDKVLNGHESVIRTLFQLQDGRLCSASEDCKILIWPLLSSKVETAELELTGHSDAVRTLTQLRDGTVVTGSWDQSIKFWSLAGGACTKTLSGHENWVVSVLCLSNGKLCSASRDEKIKLWH